MKSELYNIIKREDVKVDGVQDKTKKYDQIRLQVQLAGNVELEEGVKTFNSNIKTLCYIENERRAVDHLQAGDLVRLYIVSVPTDSGIKHLTFRGDVDPETAFFGLLELSSWKKCQDEFVEFVAKMEEAEEKKQEVRKRRK